MTEESSNANVRILIVDDEFSVRHSLTAWFEDEGYTVDVASSGKEALAKLAESKWDIFFLDLKMPGMSGLELQKKIIEIQPDGRIELEGIQFSGSDAELKDLSGQIAGLKKIAAAQGSEFFINLLPHQEATHRRIIDVMDACTKAGVDSLIFSKSI